MPQALSIHVRLHEGRYHGDGNWPPCPARLFQALVAGAGLYGELKAAGDALRWLERQSPPLVGAPFAKRGQRVMLYMPNNDMDHVGGDPHRAAKIRTARKVFEPWMFDSDIPVLYVWPELSQEGIDQAKKVCSLTNRLYQLGRGLDMAWAWGDVLENGSIDAFLASYPGRIQRPSVGSNAKNGNTLLCSHSGTLESLCERYVDHRQRFRVDHVGRSVRLTYRQAAHASFRPVVYDSSPSRYLYELRTASAESSFAPWPLSRASELVVYLRDGAVGRLKSALPNSHAEIDRVLVGRKPDGSNAGPATQRVRIIPLASIGHRRADHAIRRVLIEVPPGCALRGSDVAWGFSGRELVGEADGTPPLVVTPAGEETFLKFYGIGEGNGASVWRTVTAAALPRPTFPGGAEPRDIHRRRADGNARRNQLERVADGVIQALRHAGVGARPISIRVQREPFAGNGDRAENFAPGTRFPSVRLWHVEIAFPESIAGPLLLGDGRFLGLGVMAPFGSSESA